MKVFDTSPSRVDQPGEAQSSNPATAPQPVSSSQQAHNYYTNAALSSIKAPNGLGKRAASPPLPTLGPAPGNQLQE